MRPVCAGSQEFAKRMSGIGAAPVAFLNSHPGFRRRIRPVSRQDVSRRDLWVKVAALLVVGFLCFHRSFAYLGWPAHSIYLGEASLAAFLLLGPKVRRGGWIWALLRSGPLHTVAVLLGLSLVYAAFEALRGISLGYGTVATLRGTPFNYYPLFLLWGVWAGLRGGNLIERLAHPLAWCNGVYGTAYVLFLHRLPWILPGTSAVATPVPLFGISYASAIALLGLLSFEPNLRRVWHLIALNAFVLLGMQIRGELVGFGVGLLVLVLCTKRIKKLRSIALAATAVVAVLAAMYVTNIRVSIQSHDGIPGSQVSLDFIAAGLIAPFDMQRAEELAPYAAVHPSAANAAWRLSLWQSVWTAVNQDPFRALVGLGYGYPMWDFVNPVHSSAPLQSTHNDFFYALGFTGWIGAAIFVVSQFCIGRLLFRSFRVTAQPFGLVCWSALLTISMFEGFLEESFGAIPFYLLSGIALAPALIFGYQSQFRPGARGSRIFRDVAGAATGNGRNPLVAFSK